MYDKVSEHRELFLLVTQVGYIVKKNEKFYLVYETSLSWKAIIVSILSPIRTRLDFFGSDGSYILFNCGIELANTLINPQSYYCMPNGALHLLRLHQCSARYSATAITCVKTPKYCCSLLFISPRTFNSSVCFGQYGLSSELVS
jgi:hypothetical protein